MGWRKWFTAGVALALVLPAAAASGVDAGKAAVSAGSPATASFRIEGGIARTYDASTAAFEAGPRDGVFVLNVQGDHRLTIDATLEAGVALADDASTTFSGRPPAAHVGVSGFFFCATTSGVEVHELVMTDGRVERFRASFDVACDEGALRGQVDYAAEAAGLPAPPPSRDLWRPSRTSGGTWVELASEPGDFVGQGRRRAYDQTTAGIRLEEGDLGSNVQIAVHGDQRWSSQFIQPGLGPLRVGFYGPFTAATSPFRWDGEARGCSAGTGWFAIDELERGSDGRIRQLALRFEQRCNDLGAPPLRGAVRYDHRDVLPAANNPRPSPGPRWAPPAAAVPDSDTYVLVQGQPGSWVGEDTDGAWTETDGDLRVWLAEQPRQPSTRLVLNVMVQPPFGEAGDTWSGSFMLPRGLDEVRPGYYGRLTHGRNAVDGGLQWRGNGRGCGSVASGWFIIDDIELGAPRPGPDGDGPHDLETPIESLALRFEQRCYSRFEVFVQPAARGEIRYRSDAPRPVSRRAPVDGPAVRFADVDPGAVHGEAIERLARRGVIGGHPDGTYRPARPVTRAQLASLLVRGLQIELPDRPVQRFPDVPLDSPHAATIDAAVAAGLVQGFSDGSFRPGQPVRRDQTAAIIVRAMDMPPDATELFPDLRDNIHQDAVTMLAKSLVLTGHRDGTFRPSASLTRAQVASVLDRALAQLD
ncbi:S-layer homology domain-containing protein [Egicoccus sp. AB-alg2]|uniref:S-layer homology domain-containing protein n=1 Tax=Egicoccus sp. AB-alg2 TaxID=3242693 RepID=UPI00359E2062